MKNEAEMIISLVNRIRSCQCCAETLAEIGLIASKMAQTRHSQDISIPEDLESNRTEIQEWLEYKKERGQVYKPRGLLALWSRLREIPEKSRASAIRGSMASNYSGIFEIKSIGGRQDEPTTGASPIPGKYSHL